MAQFVRRFWRRIIRAAKHTIKTLRPKSRKFFRLVKKRIKTTVRMVTRQTVRIARHLWALAAAFLAFIIEFTLAFTAIIRLLPQLYTIYRCYSPKGVGNKFRAAFHVLAKVCVAKFTPVYSHLKTRLVAASAYAGISKVVLQPKVRKHVLRAGAAFAIVSVAIINLLLPAFRANANSLTWSSNADFLNNKISKCQTTTLSGIAVSGGEYTDATCATSGADATMSLTGSGSYVTNVRSVSAGILFTVALKMDGTVWAWGGNANGQLGDGSTTQRTLPVQVKDSTGTGIMSGVTALATGANHTVALKNDGTVWAWGSNSYGQLGDGTTTQRTLPVQTKDPTGTGYLTDVSAISAGGSHNLALKTDGTVWAWGYNVFGQLADGTTTNRYLPVQTKDPTGTGYLTAVSVISVGTYRSLALKTDGTVWAWGGNSYGQLGDGTTTQRPLPVQTKDPTGTGYLTGVAAIDAGSDQSLALKTDGTVWAWGGNAQSQLGDWSNIHRSLPVQTLEAVNFVGGYAPAGTASGYVVDAGDKRRAKWHSVAWNTEPLPAETAVVLSARTS